MARKSIIECWDEWRRLGRWPREASEVLKEVAEYIHQCSLEEATPYGGPPLGFARWAVERCRHLDARAYCARVIRANRILRRLEKVNRIIGFHPARCGGTYYRYYPLPREELLKELEEKEREYRRRRDREICAALGIPLSALED